MKNQGGHLWVVWAFFTFLNFSLFRLESFIILPCSENKTIDSISSNLTRQNKTLQSLCVLL